MHALTSPLLSSLSACPDFTSFYSDFIFFYSDAATFFFGKISLLIYLAASISESDAIFYLASFIVLRSSFGLVDVSLTYF